MRASWDAACVAPGGLRATRVCCRPVAADRDLGSVFLQVCPLGSVVVIHGLPLVSAASRSFPRTGAAGGTPLGLQLLNAVATRDATAFQRRH